MQTPKSVISEIKLRIRGIGKQIADLEKQIADLKREIYFFEQVIVRDKYVHAARKSDLTKKWMKKLKHGQQHKTNMLKAAMGGVRDD